MVMLVLEQGAKEINPNDVENGLQLVGQMITEIGKFLKE